VVFFLFVQLLYINVSRHSCKDEKRQVNVDSESREKNDNSLSFLDSEPEWSKRSEATLAVCSFGTGSDVHLYTTEGKSRYECTQACGSPIESGMTKKNLYVRKLGEWF